MDWQTMAYFRRQWRLLNLIRSMDPALLNDLISPWWRPMVLLAVTVVSVAIAVIAVRVTVSFDLNEWLRDRRDAKVRKTKMKLAKRCEHVWTLCHASMYSRCNLCLAFIPTTTLLATLDDPQVSIAGQSYNAVYRTTAGGVVATDPVGNRRK